MPGGRPAIIPFRHFSFYLACTDFRHSIFQSGVSPYGTLTPEGMALNFDKMAAKGNEFVNRLAEHLGDRENRDRAARVLRCVLHALRDRLTAEESLQLMAQLPMAIKAVYVDGWKLKPHHRIRTTEEFGLAVMQEDGRSAWRDFASVDEALLACQAVMRTLADYVSAGELHDIIAILPEEMKLDFMTWMHTP